MDDDERAGMRAAAPIVSALVMALAAGSAGAEPFSAAQPLLARNACLACHAIDYKVIGPAYTDVVAKYKGRAAGELRTYLSEFFFTDETEAQMDELLKVYPQNVTRGSPYYTGTQNALTPEFKRLASILGDLVFQSPRRFFLNAVSDKQNSWSYLSKRLKSLPVLGSVHASDLLNAYGGEDLTDFLIYLPRTWIPMAD